MVRWNGRMNARIRGGATRRSILKGKEKRRTNHCPNGHRGAHIVGMYDDITPNRTNNGNQLQEWHEDICTDTHTETATTARATCGASAGAAHTNAATMFICSILLCIYYLWTTIIDSCRFDMGCDDATFVGTGKGTLCDNGRANTRIDRGRSERDEGMGQRERLLERRSLSWSGTTRRIHA